MPRERMPDRRKSVTQKLTIHSLDRRHTLYITVGFRAGPDGKPNDNSPGEIKIVLSTTGSGTRAYTDALSYAVSIGLQYGIPLEAFVEQFIGTKYMPCGPVKGDDRIRFCSSPLDLAFRWLGIEFCGRFDLSNAPKAMEEKGGGL